MDSSLADQGRQAAARHRTSSTDFALFVDEIERVDDAAPGAANRRFDLLGLVPAFGPRKTCPGHRPGRECALVRQTARRSTAARSALVNLTSKCAMPSDL